jgi:hypothetical protein
MRVIDLARVDISMQMVRQSTGTIRARIVSLDRQLREGVQARCLAGSSRYIDKRFWLFKAMAVARHGDQQADRFGSVG